MKVDTIKHILEKQGIGCNSKIRYATQWVGGANRNVTFG